MKSQARILGLRIVLIAALLLPCCWSVVAAQVDADPFMARAYQVRHRPLADAYEVVDAVLSPEGTATLRPRLRLLVVQDRRSVLDRIESLLQAFDVPPQSVDVTLTLFLGTDRLAARGERSRAAGEGLSQEVRGVLDTLGDVTKWVAYEPLGSRSITGVEGDSVTATLSDDYRVVFKVQSVDEGAGEVRFERVALQRLETDEEGNEQVRDVYAAGMSLSAGRMHVVGAARQPGSDRALFLILQVRAR
jgi:hypothetical protein